MEVKLKFEIKHEDSKVFYDAILPDFENKGRADAEMNLGDGKIKFEIKSKDLTSVRATINSIILKLRALDNLSKVN